jgi:hypothetical protein
MATNRCRSLASIVFLSCFVFAGSLRAVEPVELHEGKPKRATRVLVTLEGKGLYRPPQSPGTDTSDPPKPLALKVETRLEFLERALDRDGDQGPARVVRRVLEAGSAINGEIRPTTAALRPEVAILLAEERPDGVFVHSPGGPLTRPELELVQGPGDPLEFHGLLPDRAVKPGDRWKVALSAARDSSAYDTVSGNTLEATLASLDGESAVVRLAGEVKGSVLGGAGSMAITGSFTFDLDAGRIARLSLERAEVRRPGPVEAGLDVKSTLTVTRSDAEIPPELSDEVLSKIRVTPVPENTFLTTGSADGKYSLLHDRKWHTYWDDPRLTVLRRIEQGELVAQCNLAVGPNAGKGKHQDLVQFRDDIRRGLGARFAGFLGAGEVEGDPAGGFRYKVGAQGKQGEVGVVWYYYLIASPEGDQLLATFTMAETQHKTFGEEDIRLIGSLRWKSAGAR